MERLFRTYELIILYIIGIVYSIAGWFRLQAFDSITIKYMYFEAAVVMLILFLARESILFLRWRRYDARSIIERGVSINLVRVAVVIVFYILLWISDFDTTRILIILTGLFLSYILPRPITESLFVTDKGCILKGIYYEFSSIDSIDLFDSGDVEITSCGRRERVAYYSKKNKRIIFEHLQGRKTKAT